MAVAQLPAPKTAYFAESIMIKVTFCISQKYIKIRSSEGIVIVCAKNLAQVLVLVKQEP
jgi:hypothetical protein